MTSYNYNEILALIQFQLFTISINLVFFPLHFLGYAGMPRRIPDYPMGYAGQNKVASYGSLLTLISVILFIYILTNGIFYNYKLTTERKFK